MKTYSSRITRIATIVIVLLAISVSSARAQQNEQNNELAIYQVTIQNLTLAQPFSPPIAATHSKEFSIFSIGQQATPALKAIAEEGDTSLMEALLADPSQASQVTDVFTQGVPLLSSGVISDSLSDSLTFAIRADPGDRLSLVAMLICTNDGFAGLGNMPLPEYGSYAYRAFAYDAGTEKNTEASEDLPDDCSELGNETLEGDPNGNAHEPPLVRLPVLPHFGIMGINNLTAVHSWSGAVAKVTVTRVADRGYLFATLLTGFGEVPPRVTAAIGTAAFALLPKENTVAFAIGTANIQNVTAAHIHYGLPHENGPILVTLFEADAPVPTVNGLLASGLITPDEVATSPILTDTYSLLQAFLAGALYVNVHTTEYPGGEIRGQLGVIHLPVPSLPPDSPLPPLPPVLPESPDELLELVKSIAEDVLTQIVDMVPVDEEPVDEEPVDEEPVDEEPVDEEPVDEEPVDEEPVDEEPVDEEPVDEEPVVEESQQGRTMFLPAIID